MANRMATKYGILSTKLSIYFLIKHIHFNRLSPFSNRRSCLLQLPAELSEAGTIGQTLLNQLEFIFGWRTICGEYFASACVHIVIVFVDCFLSVRASFSVDFRQSITISWSGRFNFKFNFRMYWGQTLTWYTTWFLVARHFFVFLSTATFVNRYSWSLATPNTAWGIAIRCACTILELRTIEEWKFRLRFGSVHCIGSSNEHDEKRNEKKPWIIIDQICLHVK